VVGSPPEPTTTRTPRWTPEFGAGLAAPGAGCTAVGEVVGVEVVEVELGGVEVVGVEAEGCVAFGIAVLGGEVVGVEAVGVAVVGTATDGGGVSEMVVLGSVAPEGARIPIEGVGTGFGLGAAEAVVESVGQVTTPTIAVKRSGSRPGASLCLRFARRVIGASTSRPQWSTMFSSPPRAWAQSLYRSHNCHPVVQLPLTGRSLPQRLSARTATQVKVR